MSNKYKHNLCLLKNKLEMIKHVDKNGNSIKVTIHFCEKS